MLVRRCLYYTDYSGCEPIINETEVLVKGRNDGKRLILENLLISCKPDGVISDFSLMLGQVERVF